MLPQISTDISLSLPPVQHQFLSPATSSTPSLPRRRSRTSATIDKGGARDIDRRLAESIANDESKRINVVEVTFQDAESIVKAIGNVSKVVVTIGPAENGPATEITTSDTAQVIQSAQLATVGHMAIIYDEATNYNVLDDIPSFFSNLFSWSQPLTVPELLQKVVEAGVSYTLIKTRLTKDFSSESSYTVVVSVEGSLGANDYK